jgi:hypothetical protein
MLRGNAKTHVLERRVVFLSACEAIVRVVSRICAASATKQVGLVQGTPS